MTTGGHFYSFFYYDCDNIFLSHIVLLCATIQASYIAHEYILKYGLLSKNSIDVCKVPEKNKYSKEIFVFL